MTNVEQLVTKQYLAAVNAVRGEEEGQGLVEYALIISLVAIALVVGLGALGTKIDGTFTNITGKLS